MRIILVLIAIVSTSTATLAPAQADNVWQSFETGTQASLRGLAAVNKQVAWACGSKATIVQTMDGGTSWLRHSIRHLVEVEIRSIHAWDSDKAIVATAGQPALIMKTIDRGVTWTTTYENKSPQAFFDGMKFHNERSGIAFSDPVDGGLLIVRTEDGGDSWLAVEPSAIPKMDANETGFAASNSSLHTFGTQLAWIGLGGGSDGPSRIFRSQDGGAKWSSQAVPPIARGMSSGIFAIAFENERNGIAVGGDYNKATSDIENIAILNDGGSTWRAPLTGRPRGFRSCVVLIPSNVTNTNKKLWLACGPSGCDSSTDGDKWTGVSEIGFHVLSVANDGSVWGAGTNGRICRLNSASLTLRE